MSVFECFFSNALYCFDNVSDVAGIVMNVMSRGLSESWKPGTNSKWKDDTGYLLYKRKNGENPVLLSFILPVWQKEAYQQY